MFKKLIFTAICVMVLTAGCATTPATTPDTTATVATPNQVATNVAILKPYLDKALEQVVPAIITYANTQDLTAADKAIYWAQYAQGVSASIATVKTAGPK